MNTQVLELNNTVNLKDSSHLDQYNDSSLNLSSIDKKKAKESIK